MPGACKIIPIINDIKRYFDCKIFTQDFHLANHNSFASNHKDKKPLDVIALADTGVDASKRQTIVNVSPPEERSAGIIVESVDQLVDKLRNEAKVI